MEQNIVCRTCLRQTKKYVSIFSAPELWGKNIVIAKLIMACAPVVIKIGDGLPTKICENCLQLLQLSFLFRLRVITANENYNEILRTQASPQLQVVADNDHQTANLNQIYSTEYIFESVNDSVPSSSKIVDAVKEEPLDIKEEIIDTNNKDSTSKISSVINDNSTLGTTTLSDNNKLNSVASNQLEMKNNRTKDINNTKKTVSCQEKNESNINNNKKSCNNSKTTNNNRQLNKDDIVFDKIEFSFSAIGNEEQIDNELNLKLINNRQRIKRTYSKISNTKKSPNSPNNSASKIPKLQEKIKVTFPTDLVSDDELEKKPLTFHNEQMNDLKNRKTANSHFNTNNNESIIIDD